MYMAGYHSAVLCCGLLAHVHHCVSDPRVMPLRDISTCIWQNIIVQFFATVYLLARVHHRVSNPRVMPSAQTRHAS